MPYRGDGCWRRCTNRPWYRVTYIEFFFKPGRRRRQAREAEKGARDGQGEAGRVVGKLADLYAGIAPPTTRMC